MCPSEVGGGWGGGKQAGKVETGSWWYYHDCHQVWCPPAPPDVNIALLVLVLPLLLNVVDVLVLLLLLLLLAARQSGAADAVRPSPLPAAGPTVTFST